MQTGPDIPLWIRFYSDWALYQSNQQRRVDALGRQHTSLRTLPVEKALAAQIMRTCDKMPMRRFVHSHRELVVYEVERYKHIHCMEFSTSDVTISTNQLKQTLWDTLL